MRGELISYYDYSSGLRLSWTQLWTWQRLICHGCAVRFKIKRPSKNHNVLKILPKIKTLRYMPRRGASRRWQNWAKPSWKGFSELAFTKDWFIIWDCKLIKVKLMHFPINTKLFCDCLNIFQTVYYFSLDLFSSIKNQHSFEACSVTPWFNVIIWFSHLIL